jgi:YVTN family beta-propeller protein
MKQALACAWLLLGMTLAGQTPAPVLLVLNKTDATMAIVDPVSGRTLATVATGPGPHEVAVSDDRRLAYVTNYGANAAGSTLSVIDVAARREIRRVDLGELRRPHGIAVVNGKVVFTVEANRAIAQYDPVVDRIDWRFDTAQDVTHMVTASRDGRTLFTSNIGSNTISIIDNTGSAWRQTLVRVGPGPEGLDLSPDGRELWTAHTGDGRVSIVDVAAKKVVQTFDAGARRANRLKFTPDGGRVLISDMDGGDLLIVDVKTRAVAKRLRVGRMPEGILIRPDGRVAYVAVTGENRVAAVDLQTMEIVQTIAAGGGPDGMAWLDIRGTRGAVNDRR